MLFLNISGAKYLNVSLSSINKEHDLFIYYSLLFIFNIFLFLRCFCPINRADPSTLDTDICLHPTGELNGYLRLSLLIAWLSFPAHWALSLPSFLFSFLLLFLPSFLPCNCRHFITPIKLEPTPVKISSAVHMPPSGSAQTTNASSSDLPRISL